MRILVWVPRGLPNNGWYTHLRNYSLPSHCASPLKTWRGAEAGRCTEWENRSVALNTLHVKSSGKMSTGPPPSSAVFFFFFHGRKVTNVQRKHGATRADHQQERQEPTLRAGPAHTPAINKPRRQRKTGHRNLRNRHGNHKKTGERPQAEKPPKKDKGTKGKTRKRKQTLSEKPQTANNESTLVQAKAQKPTKSHEPNKSHEQTRQNNNKTEQPAQKEGQQARTEKGARHKARHRPVLGHYRKPKAQSHQDH